MPSPPEQRRRTATAPSVELPITIRRPTDVNTAEPSIGASGSIADTLSHLKTADVLEGPMRMKQFLQLATMSWRQPKAAFRVRSPGRSPGNGERVIERI